MKSRPSKLHIKKDDTVVIIAGEDIGKKGKVLEVFPAKQRAIVEGANMVTKHIKPSASNPNGGIEQAEASIHISNLKLVDPASGEPTRVGRKADEKGKLQRYSKKTGEIIKNG